VSDFTYQLPFSEEKLKRTALNMLRKKDATWASLLDECRISIEERGTSYYFDKAKSSRWDAIAIVIKFFVPPKIVDSLEAFSDFILRQIFSDLIPAKVGYDVKAIKYIPDLCEPQSTETIETIDTILESIQSTPFSQAVEHYQQAKRQLDDAADE